MELFMVHDDSQPSFNQTSRILECSQYFFLRPLHYLLAAQGGPTRPLFETEQMSQASMLKLWSEHVGLVVLENDFFFFPSFISSR